MKEDKEFDAIPDILARPDKLIGNTKGVQGVLAKLLRLIFKAFDVNISQWGMYMYDYLNDVRNGIPDNRHDRTSMRGNLNKEFGRKIMTFKVFLKALKFLKFEDIHFIVRCKRRGDAGYKEVGININLYSSDDEPDQ